MKKILFVLVMLGIVAAPAAAQTIGFKVGPTFSKLSADVEAGEPDPETLTSFGGGGFIRFGFAGLALQAELLALTKGAKQTFDDGLGGTVEGKLKFNYVEIPVTAMFSLGSGPYLFAGPSVAFETGCEVELEGDDGSIEGDCDADGEEFPRKKTEVSLHGGAGFQFPLGPGQLLIEGRYIYGLTNIADDDADPDAEAKHRTWAVMAGFAIPIGGIR
jgi:hypothetical protein